MKAGPYFLVLLLAVVCIILTGALIPMAITNQRMQVKLQAQQQALNQSVLGAQAQQIRDSLLQDLAAAASSGNRPIRQLLVKHGYNVQGSPSAGGAAKPDKVERSDAPKSEQEEATEGVAQ
jgi:hypothetical protein